MQAVGACGAPHLLYFQERLGVPVAIQLVLEKGYAKDWRHGGRVQRAVSADRWLALWP